MITWQGVVLGFALSWAVSILGTIVICFWRSRDIELSEIEPPVLPRSVRWRGPDNALPAGAASNSFLRSRPASDQG